jgi:hypothetical protein
VGDFIAVQPGSKGDTVLAEATVGVMKGWDAEFSSMVTINLEKRLGTTVTTVAKKNVKDWSYVSSSTAISIVVGQSLPPFIL